MFDMFFYTPVNEHMNDYLKFLVGDLAESLGWEDVGDFNEKRRGHHKILKFRVLFQCFLC